MARLCTVCSHPDRATIDAALVGHRVGKREIARCYGLSLASVYRHRERHLPKALKEAQVKMDAESLAKSIHALNGYVRWALKSGKAANNAHVVLQAVGEGRRNIESLFKLGVLSDVERRLLALEAGEKEGGEQDGNGDDDA